MKLIALTVILCSSLFTYGQYRLEIGGKIGAANYLGDIGGIDEARPFIFDLQVPKTRFGFGGFARYMIFDYLAASAGLQYSYILGADSLSNQPERFSRNLSFRNQILEFYSRAELHFLRINDLGRTGRYTVSINAFLFGGAGVFFHNPQAQFNGSWTNLQPLKTEGKKYSRIQPMVPLGAGFFVTLKRVHRIGLDITWNLTFTDYIDDVSSVYQDPASFRDELASRLADRSGEVNPNDPRFIGTDYYGRGSASNPANPAPRGNPDNNDSYLTAFLTYSYALRGKADFRRKRYNFVTGKVKRVKSRAKF